MLVVDDEESIRSGIAQALEATCRVRAAATAEEALALLQREAFDVALCDVRLPGMDGLALMDRMLEQDPGITPVVITGYASVETAVRALKMGAYDYLVKPFTPDDIRRICERALESRRLRRENEAWRRAAGEGRREASPHVGESVQIRRIYQAADQVAATDAPVFITGESGSGKEVLARAIHARSARSHRPLVAINCAGLSEGLMDSEVFGHLKGAFTGAVADRRGALELADGGTLLLDEIAELKPDLQARLLRVLEDGTFRRLGSERSVTVNVRFIAAAQKTPEELIREGRLREDLYFRLGVVTIRVPPLRERTGDIPGLAKHLLEGLRHEMKKAVGGIEPEALACLEGYSWPGNVRELRNVLERAAIFTPPGGAISLRQIPETIRGASGTAPAFAVEAGRTLTLDELKQAYIEHVLRSCEGNHAEAARILGVAASTLWRRKPGPRS